MTFSGAPFRHFIKVRGGEGGELALETGTNGESVGYLPPSGCLNTEFALQCRILAFLRL
jgi:hypothetical protein